MSAPGGGPVERLRGLSVAMADGVELVADCWRPAGAGPLPVLLQRLPYGRTVASAPVLPAPQQLAALGYAVVVQDVRGTGDSGGSFVPFLHEAADGAATIEWAAAQPFSNGDVVTYGFSYQGTDQVAAAALRPAGLRAIAPMMCGASPYELVYEDGCLLADHATRWAAQLASIGDRQAPRPVEVGTVPLRDALGRHPPAFFLDWLADEAADGPFWAGLRPDLDRVEVPSFVVLGYADTFAKASARLAAALGAQVVAGPWAHMPWGSRLGALELGPGAGPGVAHDAFLAFIRRVLRPDGTDPDRRHAPSDGARIYVGGAGWRDAPTWPPPGHRIVLHGTSRAGANSRHGDGRLGDEPDGPLGDVLVAEPLVPRPGDGGPYPDVGPAQDRRDVLCYTTPPLGRPLVVAGSPEVVVELSADAPSLDLVAALVLVEGPVARRLAVGSRRLRTLEPGSRTEARLELGPIGWRLPAGSAMRLDLSASCFPLYGRNPQSATEPSGDAERDHHRVAVVEVAAARLELDALD